VAISPPAMNEIAPANWNTRSDRINAIRQDKQDFVHLVKSCNPVPCAFEKMLA